MKRLLLCLFVLLLLVSCAMGPDYKRPGVQVPGAFINEVSQAAETANTQWWEQFNDPVMDKLIAEALANNKSIKIAAANVDQAAAVLVQVRSPLFPQVNYSASGARDRVTEMGATPLSAQYANPATTYSVVGAASWEIDLWGRVRRLTESARANLLATESAKRGVVLSLVGSVASSYLQLRGLDEQLRIARLTLGAYAETVRLFELQFKYGVVSMMNVEQARSQYETAAAQVPALEAQISRTEYALSVLLGRNPGPIERGRPITELKIPQVPAGVPSQALQRRPDILQAEQQLVAANAQIGAARALYFPTISLTGYYGTASNDLSNLFKGPARTWSYGGSVTGPIFAGGAIWAQVKQAEAAQQAALLSYQSAIQSAFSDIESALINNQKLVEQVGAQEHLVRANQEYERLARLQYDGGYVPYSTVLQAQQQLFPSELNLVQTRSSLLASLVSIYQAMGGGWVIEAEKMTGPPPAK